MKNVTSEQAGQLTGSEPFFSDDEYLKPAIDDDPLLGMACIPFLTCIRLRTSCSSLELDTGESDSDEEAGPSSSTDPRLSEKVKKLENELKQAREDVQSLRNMIHGRLDLLESSAPEPDKPVRDDDTHYFDSYAYNGKLGPPCLLIP